MPADWLLWLIGGPAHIVVSLGVSCGQFAFSVARHDGRLPGLRQLHGCVQNEWLEFGKQGRASWLGSSNLFYPVQERGGQLPHEVQQELSDSEVPIADTLTDLGRTDGVRGSGCKTRLYDREKPQIHKREKQK